MDSFEDSEQQIDPQQWVYAKLHILAKSAAHPPPVNTGKGVRATGKNDVSQFQTLMLPLLKAMGDGHEMTTIQMRVAVAADLGMGATALSQPLPDGTQNDFDNRLG